MAAKKKILVIDDDSTVHTITRTLFEQAGYQVFQANDTLQGIMLAKQIKPDLIVLDILMPAGGGFAVFERLQRMAGFFRSSYLIYSTVPVAEIQAKIHESPTVKILSKTSKFEDVLAAAAELMAPPQTGL